MTLEQLAIAIQVTREQEGFHEFSESVEKQILRMVKDGSRKLYWRKDVSGGMKQAFLAMWTKVQ